MKEKSGLYDKTITSLYSLYFTLTFTFFTHLICFRVITIKCANETISDFWGRIFILFGWCLYFFFVIIFLFLFRRIITGFSISKVLTLRRKVLTLRRIVVFCKWRNVIQYIDSIQKKKLEFFLSRQYLYLFSIHFNDIVIFERTQNYTCLIQFFLTNCTDVQ